MKDYTRKSGFILSLTAMLIIAACGGGNTAESTNSDVNTSSNNNAEAPANPRSQTGDSSWDAVVEAAKKEGAINIITHPGILEQQWVAEFQKAYPEIKVEHSGIRPSDAGPKVVSEQQNNQFLYDVMVAATSNMTSVMAPAGTFVEIDSIIKSLPNAVEDKWYGGVDFYSQNLTDKKYTFIHAMELYSGAFINKEVKGSENFKGIEDLVNPEFKGKIIITEPNVPAHGSLTLTGVLQTKGEDFLKKLYAEQDVTFGDVVLSTNWLGDGRVVVAVGADKSRIIELQKAGLCTKCEPIIYEGMPTLSRGFSFFKNAPHPNASKVFMNWLMSKEGGEAFSKNLSLNSRRTDVEPYSTPINWDKLDGYVLNGTESGQPILDKVMNLYNEVQKGK